MSVAPRNLLPRASVFVSPEMLPCANGVLVTFIVFLEPSLSIVRFHPAASASLSFSLSPSRTSEPRVHVALQSAHVFVGLDLATQ